MSLDTRRLDDGTLVIRPPPIVARCAACDVGILAGAPIAHGSPSYCSLECMSVVPPAANTFRCWSPRGLPAEDNEALVRIRVDWAWFSSGPSEPIEAHR